MKEEKHVFKKVSLPHLAYTVVFKDLSSLKGVEIKGGAYTVEFDEHSSYVFIFDIAETVKKPHNFPLIAHELTHVLQNICKARLMTFGEEKEHTAYIMAYLLNEVLGYSFNTKVAPKSH